MERHNWKDYPNSIFVFGSNKKGIHGAGAALYAMENCSAKWGTGFGLTGRSYALPTCSAPGIPLTNPEVCFHLDQFLEYARNHPEMTFFLTKVGCGFAGFSEVFIRSNLINVPENVIMPPDWRPSTDRIDLT